MSFDIQKFSSKITDFVGVSNKKENKLNKTLTVVITCNPKVGGVANYALFAGDVYGYTDGAGSDGEVTIQVKESSHAQVRRETANIPFVIDKILWSTSDETNLLYNLLPSSREYTGQFDQLQVQPGNYLEPENQFSTNKNIRITDLEGFLIDGTHGILGQIKANTTITMVITLKEKVERQNIVNGEQIVVETEPTNKTPLQVELVNNINPNCTTYNV